ncbi:TadE/TadG family type IV pilus assembly protein [Hyphomonas sp. UBA4494]|jgi:Flp pilus assembly protein TadG|uniref:TadE/TadG family type IV pilus assembly protein n=1 Tax=Hyphomonas sp. UBA4494 TaxID=1946631 RepID=UPI0025BC0CB7|nr:TadE/TadG family type IV pilus assembly protein [Hyphomonas sp. UBA4494]
MICSKRNIKKTTLFARNTFGGAGVEFAIAAPILLLVVLSMMDYGLAFSRQMNLDQSVRAGAEFAMGGVDDTSKIEDLVIAAATGYSRDEIQDVGEDAPTAEVTEVCRCPGSGVEVSCTASCSGASPSRFYSITASEEYDPIFIRVINLSASMQVQVQ